MQERIDKYKKNIEKENNLESHPPPLALSDGFMLDESHFAAKGCSAESFSETTSLELDNQIAVGWVIFFH